MCECGECEESGGREANGAGEHRFDNPLLLVKKKKKRFPSIKTFVLFHLPLTFKRRVQRLALLYCPSDAMRAQVSGTLVLK